MKPVNLMVVGAGSRGFAYADYAAKHPDRARIVAVAEPRKFPREKMAVEQGIPQENQFSDWRELIEKNMDADGVVIATQDSQHLEPAVAFADKGCNLLLEKPMASDEDGCRKIVEAAVRNKIIFGVCHVLRYTDYTRKVKELLDSGIIGEIVGIDSMEPIGYWHFAHSYVRGNWRKESESSPMLLAKSCHDLDWIRYMMGCGCRKISSFGSLNYFTKEHQPENAGSRCLDCPLEAQCAYSAKKIYLGRVEKGDIRWPVDVLTDDLTMDGVAKALETGPYGRCVWDCDNDVVDHQIVNMEFENGKTASFTATAFTEGGRDRQTRIYGTKGELRGDGSKVEIFDYFTNKTTVFGAAVSDGSILSGHGGGDYNIMESFVSALASNDPGKILSGPAETLETHLMTFAAEKARRTNTVVEMKA